MLVLRVAVKVTAKLKIAVIRIAKQFCAISTTTIIERFCGNVTEAARQEEELWFNMLSCIEPVPSESKTPN
jgi:hypothetical protein